MNKFRDNLHSAFFIDSFETGSFENEDLNPEYLEAITEFKGEEIELKKEVVDTLEFSHISEAVAAGKAETEDFDSKKEIFNQRIESLNPQGKRYAEVWDERIKNGYKELLSTLQGNDNFDKLEGEQRTKILKSLAGMYSNVVKGQCSKNIWDADENDFNKVKDTIFTDQSSEYPVNVVIDQIFTKYANDIKKANEMARANRKAYRHEDISEDKISANLDIIKDRSFRQKKDFLCEDLRKYGFKTETPGFFERLGRAVGITKVNNKVSEQDQKAIKNFLEVVDDIANEGKINHEEALQALMKLLKDHHLTVNSSRKDYEQAIKNNDIKGDVNVKRIMNVGEMYFKTRRQGNKIEDQHNIYYAIIQCLDEKGIDGTIAMFKDEVEEYKKNGEMDNEKAEKELSTKYPELFKISNKFGKDFASALRLAKMGEDDFKYRKPVDILADLDNNKHVRINDVGVTKSGPQFKRVAEIYGEEKVLKDLLAQAKIANNMMGLGLDPDKDFEIKKIQEGKKELILLLQSIISQPGGDFATMIGLDDNRIKQLEKIAPKGPNDPEVREMAEYMISNIDLEGLKGIPGIGEIATEAGLRQAVAGAMYAEYMKGVGLGTTIPFKEWAKGLALNVGVQKGNDGVFGLGLALDYSKEIDLGNGRSVTPGASIGFIGILSNDGRKIPGFGGTIDATVAKARVDDKGIQQKLGLTVGGTISVLKEGLEPKFGAFAGVHWNQDKLAGMEEARDRKEEICHDEFIAPLIKSISDALGNNKVLDLDNKDVVSTVRDTIRTEIQKALTEKNISGIDENTMVDNTMRFLSFYNKYDLSTEVMREVIAKGISKQCALARESDRLQNIDDDTYFSGAGIGIAYAGMFIPHVSASWKKHQHDTFGDRNFTEYKIEMPNEFKVRTSRNYKMIDDFNRYLPDEEGKKLKLAEYEGENFVVIPESLLNDVYVNPEMKGKMKKEDGNVLLHVETYMDWPTLYMGVATESVVINVGGASENMQKLSTCGDDWFTTEPINPETLPGKDFIVTPELLDLAMNDLRNNVPSDIKSRLDGYRLPDHVVNYKFIKNKKYTVVIDDKWNATPEARVEDGGQGRGVSIEYHGRKSVELVSNEAQSIANYAYKQANMVVSNELNNISHESAQHKLYPTYKKFATAMKNQNYEEAKTIILKMLPLMDYYINRYQPKGKKVAFNGIATDLQSLGGAELGKALMSINNIFARVQGVRGGVDGQYSFIYGQRPASMNTIIESRAKGIRSGINKSKELPNDAKEAYNNLIDFTENYRENEHPEKYTAQTKKTTTLKNAIGINLGNSISTENPLFNPEVYEDSIIESEEITFEKKDVLYNRILKVIAGNKALMSPILKALGLDDNVDIQPSDIRNENGEFIIDINEKKVILKADMKIAYYAQCVNHMLILDNIHAEILGEGKSIDFGPSSGGDGFWNESTGARIYSSTQTKLGVGAGVDGTNDGHSQSIGDQGGIGYNNNQNNYGVQ